MSKLKLGVAREGIQQTSLEIQEFTLKELAEQIKNHTPGTKFGAYFVRGEAERRKDSELKNIQLITIDGDSSLNNPHSAPDPKKAHDILKQAGYNHLIYPSFSNSEEKIRWRAIIPCNGISTREEFISATNDITTLLQENGCLVNPAKENYTLSQAWFITKPENSSHHGWDLLCDDLKDYHTNGSKRGAPQTIVWDHKNAPHQGSASQFKSISAEDALMNIKKGIAIHPSLVSLAGRLATQGYSPEAIVTFLKGALAISEANQERPGRLDDIDGEVNSIVSWIEERREEEDAPAACPALDVGLLLSSDPPKREWLFTNILTRGAVNVTSGEGGIGKSNLSLLMALSGAGGVEMEPFVPCSPLRIMMINAEDSGDEIHRRIHALGQRVSLSKEQKEQLSKNLLLYPARGKIGPLMELDKNRNPIISKHGLWLKNTIVQEKPDLVFLDTKSRLYGLSENDNDHAAQWIAMLENMSEEHDVSFVILSHTGKNSTNMNNSYASRGASAISDNARSGISLAHLSSEELDLFGVDSHQYFKMLLTKSNYSPYTGKIWYFRKEEEGVPVLVDLKEELLSEPKRVLKEFLNSHEYSARQLKNEKTGPGADIKNELAEQFGFGRDRLIELVQKMTSDGELFLEEIRTESGRMSKILRVSFTGENQ